VKGRGGWLEAGRGRDVALLGRPAPRRNRWGRGRKSRSGVPTLATLQFALHVDATSACAASLMFYLV
jgi:hypothetical protein